VHISFLIFSVFHAQRYYSLNFLSGFSLGFAKDSNKLQAGEFTSAKKMLLTK